MIVVENIERYCKARGITDAEFEKKCQLGKGSISKWRNCGNIPTVRTLTKIQTATGISMSTWLRKGALSYAKKETKVSVSNETD